MSALRLLDLFCGQGGAGTGYASVGFEVVGVDIAPQPRYPFDFIKADALTFPLDGFDAVHASPPCQDWSATNQLGGDHETAWMLAATRDRLAASGLPWIVENVQGAPLAHQPDLFGANGLTLCGCMFPSTRGLLYEARLFETSFSVPQPSHVPHIWPQTKMGRPPRSGECMQVTGHFSDVREAQRRMGAPWMSGRGLAQAIVPAYTTFIGEQLLAQIKAAA